MEKKQNSSVPYPFLLQTGTLFIPTSDRLYSQSPKKEKRKEKRKKGVLGKVLSLGVARSVELVDVC
jgi:hypothetical protein